MILFRGIIKTHLKNNYIIPEKGAAAKLKELPQRHRRIEDKKYSDNEINVTFKKSRTMEDKIKKKRRCGFKYYILNISPGRQMPFFHFQLFSSRLYTV